MRKKLILLLFLLALALCICMVTNVLSLFPGTHTLTDLSSDDNDISCTGCHGEIQKQLSNSSIHLDFDCEDCHRFPGTGIDFAAHTPSGYQIGNQAHAAYTPRCLDCHGEGGYATQATAFNELGYGSDVSAHKPLVKQSLDYDLSVGENEACLACHTNYSIVNVFKRPEYFDFTESGWGGSAGNITINEVGPTNATTITKSESGAKHEFKALNQIKCEDCHSDIWQAANHSESNGYGSTKASHVCWKWAHSGTSHYTKMHDVSYVSVSSGYDNITDYCLLSCHNPEINPSATIPPVFQETIHAAYRVSCYHCHNSSTYTNAFRNKPENGWDTPEFSGHSGHEVLDDKALAECLFLNAETCIACKRAGAPHGDEHFKTWTEPNNTIYWYGTGYI